MSLAVANYHDVHGCFPPPYLADENGVPMHSWRVLLLPFIEEQSLHDRYRYDEPWNGPNNSKLHAEMPRTFRFSFLSDDDTTQTNYLAVIGPHTMWPKSGQRTYNDVTDGPDETIHFVECRDSGIHWMEPRDLHLEEMTLTIDTDPRNGISSWHEPPAIATRNSDATRNQPFAKFRAKHAGDQ